MLAPSKTCDRRVNLIEGGDGAFTCAQIFNREADRDGAPPVELVDGQKLVKMFENLELGMKPKTVYEVDHSFFAPFKVDGLKLEN